MALQAAQQQCVEWRIQDIGFGLVVKGGPTMTSRGRMEVRKDGCYVALRHVKDCVSLKDAGSRVADPGFGVQGR